MLPLTIKCCYVFVFVPSWNEVINLNYFEITTSWYDYVLNIK